MPGDARPKRPCWVDRLEIGERNPFRYVIQRCEKQRLAMKMGDSRAVLREAFPTVCVLWLRSRQQQRQHELQRLPVGDGLRRLSEWRHGVRT